MIGSTETMRNQPRKRDVVRVTSNAKASPNNVHATAHALASAIVFHTTPQRAFDATQANPHSLSAASLAAKASIDTVSPGPCNADTSVFETGKNVNNVTRTAIETTLPAMNAS